MKSIGVVTVSRSDFGHYLPILRRIESDSNLTLQLFVSGMHLSADYGLTVRAIEAAGIPITDRIEMLLSSDTPEAIAKSIGLGVIGFAQTLSRLRPDVLLLLGDRFEMLAAAVAALPLGLPLAHIHGGEATEGVIDEAIRHSLTKMSHLHFVATERYRDRVVQMGEEPWRVTVCGAPGLDNVHTVAPLSRDEVSARLGLSLAEPPLLVTFHPVTLGDARPDLEADELVHALDTVGLPVVFTYPNADTRNRGIVDRIRAYAEGHANARVVHNLGTELYFSLMRYAAAMVGNSSSGIIEAASFGLPVVNIGARQQGRVRGANVIDVACERQAIARAIAQASTPAFRATSVAVENPYGDGRSADRIVDVLKRTAVDDRLLVKRFHELATA